MSNPAPPRSISDRLSELVERIEGVGAAALVDQDGLTVEGCGHPGSGVEFEALSAESIRVLAEARDTATRLECGELMELQLGGERGRLLLGAVLGGYVLVLWLEPTAMLGKARFYLQRTAFSLRSEV